MRNNILAMLIVLAAGIVKGQPIPYEWALGHPYTSKIDAAFPLNQNYIGIISGRNIRFEPMVRSFDIVPTEAVLDAGLFPSQYASNPISDVISVNDTVALFFKGSTYVPVHKYTLSPLGNPATWTGLPGLWSNDIDAACEWGNGAYCFIKGLQYVLYDPFRRTYGAPQLLNRLPGWPTTWTASIDAAFNGGDGYLYFVRKGMILAYDARSLSPAPGEPRSLAGQNMNAIPVAPADGQAPNLSAAKSGGNGGGAGPNSSTAFDPNVPWCAVGDIVKFSDLNSRNTPKETADFGMPGGKVFKDWTPPYSRISEIRVWGTGPLTAIQIVAVSKKGDVTEGDIHGEAWGNPEVFVLRQDECIKGVQGTYGGPAGDYIYTLQFVTTERKSQVFGEFNGKRGTKDFKIEIYLEDALTGLKVRASKYLHSIALQYRTYGLLTVDGNGVPHEYVLGDSINKPVEDPNKPKDPWFDNHADVTLDELKLSPIQPLPMRDMLGKSVDFTKLDPLNYGATPFPPMTPLHMRTNKNLFAQGYLLPYGTNLNSGVNNSIGKEDETIKILNSFSSFQREFSVAIGGQFDAAGCASGGANYGHTERKTNSIGSERVMITKRVTRSLKTVNFDLYWRDPGTGKKMRQALNVVFREAVQKLPVPSGGVGSIPTIPTSKLTKGGGAIPSNLKSYQAAYNALIKDFGTHFFNNVEFGGHYMQYMMMTKEEIEKSKFTLDSLSARFKAGVPGKGSVGGSVAGSMSTSTTVRSGTTNTEIHTSVTGAGGNTDLYQWQAGLATDPSFENCKLFCHAILLDSIFFPFDPDIYKKQKLLDLFIRQHMVDNNAAATHDWNASIPFISKEAADARANTVKLKMEIVGLKINGEGDGDYNMIFGGLNYAIYNDDKLVNQSGFWDYPNQDSKISFSPNSTMAINKSYVFNSSLDSKDNLKLVIWGWIQEYDKYSDNETLFNIRSAVDGATVDFSGLQSPGNTITVPVTLTAGSGDGSLSPELTVKLSWVKEQ